MLFSLGSQLSRYVMNAQTVGKFSLLIACLSGVSCHRPSAHVEASPFRIIATDAGFEAPDSVPAGMRHISYENHGSEIHEAMLVKLPQGMTRGIGRALDHNPDRRRHHA
jgi:hypothetical protein